MAALKNRSSHGLALACMAGAVLVSSAALAQTAQPAPAIKLLPHDHPAVRASAGGWELESDKGRKCRLQLNPKDKRADLMAGVPAPCRRSIPALAAVQLWGLGEDGRIVLRDGKGQPVGEFVRGAEGPMTGRMGNVALTLQPVSGRYPEPARMAALAAVASAPQPRDDFSLAPPPPPEQTPGLYTMLRAQRKEACRLMLTGEPMQATRGAPPPRPEVKAARFEGNCPDVGISTFDPVGWRMADNRLFLVARKGHEAGFSYGTDRLWRRDPAVGQILMIRRD
jgi:Protease inhibitor Inh